MPSSPDLPPADLPPADLPPADLPPADLLPEADPGPAAPPPPSSRAPARSTEDRDTQDRDTQDRDTEHRDTQDRDTGQLLSQLRGMPADDQRYEELRAQIVARHVGLARSIARRYANRGEPAEDLEQAALVGLVKAINGFDPLRGHDFIAYARPMMNGEIKRHFRDLTWAVRVPRKYQEGRLELSQAVAALTQRLRRPPTTTELAAELRLSMDDLTSLMAAAGAYSALSLSLPDGPDDQRTLGDSLGAMDEELAAVEDRESLQPLLDALPPRELRLLLLRFFGNQTQAEIAAELGVSQMQVSRLLATTLARLRKSMLT